MCSRSRCRAKRASLGSFCCSPSGLGWEPEGVGWVDPRSLGDGLFRIVDFGIAIILFEGGLNLEWSRLKRQEASIRRLITLGAAITLGGAVALAHVALGWSWDLSLLFGSLVVVTGPTVVGPLLRDMRLRPRLRTILEAEGVLIDPIGALLAVSVLQVVTRPALDAVTHEAGLVAASLSFGLVAGFLAGTLLVLAMRYRVLVASGYEHIFTLSAGILLFETCGAVVEESGLMAVTVAGIVVGNFETGVGEELREFKDRLTVMLVGVLFVLLTASVALDDVRALGRPGLLVVGGLDCAGTPCQRLAGYDRPELIGGRPVVHCGCGAAHGRDAESSRNRWGRGTRRAGLPGDWRGGRCVQPVGSTTCGSAGGPVAAA